MVKPGFYIHTPSGRIYQVLGVALHSEKPERQLVIYKQSTPMQLRGTKRVLPVGSLWARPVSIFLQPVFNSTVGLWVPRFLRISQQ